MYEVELRRTERILKTKNRMGTLRNKDIYLFGVSDNTRQIIQILRRMGYEPIAVIDNDETKQGSFCSRLRVISMEEVLEPNKENKLYLIYSAYWREMIPQLLDYDIKKKNIIRLIRRRRVFAGIMTDAFIGSLVNRRIKNEFGNIPIFVCPYTGTGDVYLIGTFWEEYVKRNEITDYVFVVISGACKKVASLFDIKNIYLLKDKREVSYLIYYYLYNPDKGRIKLLNDCWPQVHTNQIEWFRGYKNLYFTDLFRKFVFDLPDCVKLKHPVLVDKSETLNELFKDNELIPNKTVVLSPYSNTLSDLPEYFWVEIAKYLLSKGYEVVTNSCGLTEPVIEGTKGVFFSLDMAPQFIEYASAFIGVRSGFCDVISGCKAKKIVLYDKQNRFYMGGAFEYFSLKSMGLCDDAIELQYDNMNLTETMQKIMNEFM